MNTQDNAPPDFDLQPQWKWPCGKVGYRPEHLFTTLHARFNMVSTRLQSLEAFHLDVYEAAKQASSQSEFHELLETRQQQRLHELQHAIDGMVSELVAAPKRMPPAMWEACYPWFADRSIESVAHMLEPFSETKPAPAAAAAAPAALVPGLLLPPLPPPNVNADTKSQQVVPPTADDTKSHQVPPTADDHHQAGRPAGRSVATKTPRRHIASKARCGGGGGGVAKRSSERGRHARPTSHVGKEKKTMEMRADAEAGMRAQETSISIITGASKGGGGGGGGGRYNLRSRR